MLCIRELVTGLEGQTAQRLVGARVALVPKRLSSHPKGFFSSVQFSELNKPLG